MKTVVMTGGTSGFGAYATRQIAAHSGTKLILGARGPCPEGIESIPLDLTSLDSVRAFATSVIERLGDTEIDALVLNAGMLAGNVDDRTVDGFETTFAVNHLAHYLLLRLLLGYLADGAVVVSTTSGAHDPVEKAGLPIPLHANADLLAHPEREKRREQPMTAGRRAYTASKLCNILTIRGLTALPDAHTRNITGIAYCPGQTPGTGLVRAMPLPLRAGWRLLGGPLRIFSPQLSSREAAGENLASLGLRLEAPPTGKYYATLRGGRIFWQEPSELARRDDLRSALWNDSARLVGYDRLQSLTA